MGFLACVLCCASATDVRANARKFAFKIKSGLKHGNVEGSEGVLFNIPKLGNALKCLCANADKSKQAQCRDILEELNTLAYYVEGVQEECSKTYDFHVQQQ